ncbi:MAG: hypothetical protein HOE61_16180 [Candidatus Marinimicrobia bacterium]|nr:hypothetical protein [Candidatus Neomarinimicrobiota bacterium]
MITFLILFVISTFFDMGGFTLPSSVVTAILIGGGGVAIIGLWDDIHPLPIYFRIAVHVIATLIVLKLITVPTIPIGDNWNVEIGFPFVFISIIWLLNLFNFMDGIDGIVGVEVVTTLSMAIIILFAQSSMVPIIYWMALFIAAMLGFLVWNWSPAKIFMGDAASVFSGFMVGVFILITSVEETVNSGLNLWAWVILLSVFIVDASWTLIRRMVFCHERWWSAHRTHSYQLLVIQVSQYYQPLLNANEMTVSEVRTKAHRTVSLGVAVINVVWLFPFAYLATIYPGWGLLFLMISMTPLLLISYRINSSCSYSGDKVKS